LFEKTKSSVSPKEFAKAHIRCVQADPGDHGKDEKYPAELLK